MLFSYGWLQSFFGKKLPEPRELARLILKHGFEVEGLEKKKNDWVFDINILSNRPDCRSHIGMAREIGAILGYKPNFYKIKPAKGKNQPAAKSMVAVEVQSPEICPRYTAMVMAGVKIGPSPDWMVRRLEICGLRSINNVVDATNYVMLETGQPLHAFDWDKLKNADSKSKAKKIIVRPAKKGEKLESLDGKTYGLTPEILLIADGSGPLAAAGIKGGRRAEIDKNTAVIVVESANFNPRAIRRASRYLGLVTDASQRFEHNIDATQTLDVARRVCETIEKLAGGKILAGAVDRAGALAKPQKLIFNLQKAEKLLGAELQSAMVKKHLEALGLAVRKAGRDNIEVTIPPRRGDINAAEDLIEEIGRIAGYDRILPELPLAPVRPPKKNYSWFWKNRIKDIMAAAGYSETRNYSFISGNDGRVFGIDKNNLLEITNPVNEDLRFLRPSLLPNLFKSMAKNHGRGGLRQFEVGKIFGKNLRMEPVMLAGYCPAGDFFELKGLLESLCSKIGVGNIKFMPAQTCKTDVSEKIFRKNHLAKIMADGKEIGFLAQTSGQIQEALGIGPWAVFELSVDDLAARATDKIEYRLLPIYPKSLRDISVDMPVRALAADVAEAVKTADKAKIIENFEIPNPPYVYPDKINKNILFRFHLRSSKKTLEAAEINDWQEKSVAAIEKNPEWRVKK